MTATWTKLKSGKWGVRITGGKSKSGESINVETRNGSTSMVVLGRMLWRNNGVAIYTVTERKDRNISCAECGRPGNLVHDEEDGLLKHYNCCDMPPGFAGE